MSQRLALLLVVALSLASCDRMEVKVLQVVRSPDGVHEASVEEHIYGPHFGGETPAVEVHLRRVSKFKFSGESGLVFQASSEGNTVAARWLGTDKLQVSHSILVPVGSAKPSYDGVSVELKAQ